MDDSDKPAQDESQPTPELQPESQSAPEAQPLPEFGMNAFGPTERKQFGQNVRLAMACIEAPPEQVKGYALPQDENSIRQRLKALSQEITSNHADLLELLVRFDDVQGWKSSGLNHCAAWMNVEIGISIQLSWEYLRVGRKLQTLPTVQALFRVGKLSWSKVRLITRVADIHNEKILCHAALDASVSDVDQLCAEYRWNENEDVEGENARALQQWTSRALTWQEASNGSTRIQLILPPELAQAFLNSVEQSLNQLGAVSDISENTNSKDTNSKDTNRKDTASTTSTTLSQSRADAAVLMAETSLQNAGRSIATADRYQVSVSVNASDLASANASTPNASTPNASTPDDTSSDDITFDVNRHDPHTPSKRPTLNGVGPIARETARRITCDCSVSINSTDSTNNHSSEPVNIGRKSRIWTNAMARVIKERDQHCAWPGCTHSRHLHIHHIKHWADGGETSVHNGVCLCSFHHTMVHEGGYRIEQVEANTQRLHEQFVQQQHNDDINQFDFERSLRNDNDSFNTVRKLSPTRFRYRILDANGQQVLSGYFSDNAQSDNSKSDDVQRDDVQSDGAKSDGAKSDGAKSEASWSADDLRDVSDLEPIDSAYEVHADSTRVYKDSTCVYENDATREDSAEYTCVYRNDTKHEDLDGSTRVYKNVAAQTGQYSTMPWWCNTSAFTNEAAPNYAMHA